MQSKIILVSQEAESRDLSTAFAIHIALAKTILGSQGTFIASHTVLICWRVTTLVSVETVLDWHKVCLASPEAVIGSRDLCTLSLNRDLLLRGNHRGSSYVDLPVLAHM